MPAVAAVDVILEALDVTDASRLTGDAMLALADGGLELFIGECERERSELTGGINVFNVDESVAG